MSNSIGSNRFARVPDSAASESWAKGALTAIGIDTDEVELATIDAVQSRLRRAAAEPLMDLDLSGVEPS